MTRSRPPKISKDVLEYQYVTLKKQQIEISKEFNISDTTLRKYLRNYNIQIRPKGYNMIGQPRHFLRKFVGCISGTMYSKYRTWAKKRNKDFKITKQYLYKVLKDQDFKCALTGQPLKFQKIVNGKRQALECNASIDRRDNSKGYIKGNVQWVLKEINMMKQQYSQDQFISLCKLVAKFKGGVN